MAAPHPDDQPLVVCDLDGVVWLGDRPIPGAGAAIDRLRRAGCRLLFVTNNSSQPVARVVERLHRAGVDADDGEVLTSAVAAAGLLARTEAPGSVVLACAGPGVVEALEERGFEVVGEGRCAAVVVGWHTDFDFGRLSAAAGAIRDGARFVATNLDATYPAAGGLLPGNGAIVAAVGVAAGRDPEVAGKPEPPMVEMVRQRAGRAGGIVIGDRPSSDGAFARALDWPFVLVESEVTATEAGAAGSELRGHDLSSLVEPVLDRLGVAPSPPRGR